MNDYPCLSCGKYNAGKNYCSWDCSINYAKKNGGTIHCPNNLPIVCIKSDNSMWEHEHADHPDYKFPVEVNTEMTLSSLSDFDGATLKEGIYYSDPMPHIESHALIYTDGCVALTMYECCYFLFFLNKEPVHESKNKDLVMTSESVKKIKEFCNVQKES